MSPKNKDDKTDIEKDDETDIKKNDETDIEKDDDFDVNEKLIKTLKELNEIKEKTVPKEKYEDIVKQNQRLINDIINKRSDKPAKTSKDLAKEIADFKGTNLDYFKKVLELRNTVISEGGNDPFLPNRESGEISQKEIEQAKRVADGMQKIVDSCHDNPKHFKTYFDDNVSESVPNHAWKSITKNMKSEGV